MYNIKYKKKSGLMLYEMILSVFIIMLCSGFILQLFLYSKSVNSKANDIDNSSLILLNAMELSKNFPTLNKYYKDEFFDGSIITNSDDENSVVFKFYDENWNTLYNITDKDNITENVRYVMELNINEEMSNSRNAVLTFASNDPNKTTYGNSSGIKYKIYGKIYYVNDPNDILIQLQTTSYFGNNIK